jgi:hypothetical protein
LLEMARRRFMGRSAVLSAVLGKGGKPALPRVARATHPYWHGAWHDGSRPPSPIRNAAET